MTSRARISAGDTDPFLELERLLAQGLRTLRAGFEKNWTPDDFEIQLYGPASRVYDESTDSVVERHFDQSIGQFREVRISFDDYVRKRVQPLLDSIVERYTLEVRRRSDKKAAEWLYALDHGRLLSLVDLLDSVEAQPGREALQEMLEETVQRIDYCTPWIRTKESTERGRPLDAQVPQDRIVEMVRTRLDSETKRFRHQDGARSGEPNVNALLEDIMDEWQGLVDLMSKRGLVGRVKKAIEEIRADMQ